VSTHIHCPNCGDRPLEEFLYGEIPQVPDVITDSDERDLDRGFMHENLEGAVVERWFHAYGCRRWTTVNRDTRSDKILLG
jgi:heterotetrameric sarcosine oxidase delta subunit